MALASQAQGVTIGLSGEMGTGKTTLIGGLVSALPGGERAAVSSPTWSLVNVYATTPPVAHVDAWRLTPVDELGPLGLDALPGNAIVLVEWITNAPELLDRADLLVSIEAGGMYARRIVVESRTAVGDLVLASL